MKTKLLITVLLCITIGACKSNAQGTQTENYSTQTVGGFSTFSYPAVTYDLSSLNGSQNTRLLFTSGLGTGASNYGVSLVINGTEFNLVNVSAAGGIFLTATEELTTSLSNTSHSIILRVRAASATPVEFTNPQLIISPTETDQLANDISSLQSTVSTLNTTLTTQGSNITDLLTSISSLQTQLSALDAAVAAIPTTAGTITDLTSTEASLSSLNNAITALNGQLDTIESNSDPLSPTNLGLSIGPAIAGILANAFIPSGFDAPVSFDDEFLFIEE